MPDRMPGRHYRGVDDAVQQMSVYLTTLSKRAQAKTLKYCFYDILSDGNDHCLAAI